MHNKKLIRLAFIGALTLSSATSMVIANDTITLTEEQKQEILASCNYEAEGMEQAEAETYISNCVIDLEAEALNESIDEEDVEAEGFLDESAPE